MKEMNFDLSNELNIEINDIKEAITDSIGLNRYLFVGKVGTGKLETIKMIAKDLNKNVCLIEINNFGSKTLFGKLRYLNMIFKQIKKRLFIMNSMVVFEGIDKILFNYSKVKQNKKLLDKFMGFLSQIDKEASVFVTCNSLKVLDKEFVKGFTCVIDFDDYSIDFLFNVAQKIIEEKIGNTYKLKNKELMCKILTMFFPLPTQGDLRKILSGVVELTEEECLRKIYSKVKQFDSSEEIKFLYKNWFTVEEIEILTGVNQIDIKETIKG